MATGDAQVDAAANARIGEVNHTARTVAYVLLAVHAAVQAAGLVMTGLGARPVRRGGALGRDVAWPLEPLLSAGGAGARLTPSF